MFSGSLLATVPVIDIAPLVAKTKGAAAVADEIGRACRDCGFFYVSGHGVSESLQKDLEHLSQEFFRLPKEKKMRIAMANGGLAWRGYFPLGDELTSGKPDLKEGIYFGQELAAEHPLVQNNTPLHGPNLFPEDMPALRRTVLDYMKAMTELSHAIMGGVALSLGKEESYFYDRYTKDPLILFRIFNYPPPTAAPHLMAPWGVGEHTDYGILTVLKQDDCGGLEVKSKTGWIAAPPIANTFVCNIGDMLDRMTGGLYRSTPHRVLNTAGRTRLSFPFFFDPNFFAEVKPIAGLVHAEARDEQAERWDKANIHAFQGTYGEYLLNKVGKVFPDLKRQVLT